MPSTNHMEYNKYGMVGHNNNQMTIILNRIERQLGLSVLPLPDGLKKDDWARIIIEDTIPVFSQYFPYEVITLIDPTLSKDGYAFIDQNLPEGARILGVRDISWESYRSDPRVDRYGMSVYSQDFLSREYAVDDIALTVTGNDLMSLFQNGIFIEFLYPNKIKLTSVNGFPVSQYRPFPLKILIEHLPNLSSLSPTYMETFIKLAKCDIALAIWNVLKYYDNMDTSYATLALQLDTLQENANARSDVIRELEEAHVTTANEHQPIMMTV